MPTFGVSPNLNTDLTAEKTSLTQLYQCSRQGLNGFELPNGDACDEVKEQADRTDGRGNKVPSLSPQFCKLLQTTVADWDAASYDESTSAGLVDSVLCYAATQLLENLCTCGHSAGPILEALHSSPAAAQQFLLLAHLYAKADAAALAFVRDQLLKPNNTAVQAKVGVAVAGSALAAAAAAAASQNQDIKELVERVLPSLASRPKLMLAALAAAAVGCATYVLWRRRSKAVQRASRLQADVQVVQHQPPEVLASLISALFTSQDDVDAVREACIGVSAYQKLEKLQNLLQVLGYESSADVVSSDSGVAAVPVLPPAITAEPSGFKKAVVIFEVEGGNDKGPDGHRKDTLPIAEALQKLGWDCRVVFYRDDSRWEIAEWVSQYADAFISRINPGKYPTYSEDLYFEMCQWLIKQGLVPLPSPDAARTFGAKDALVKCAKTSVGLEDTYAYYDVDSFHLQFPESIKLNDRVLKQNRGSTGQGIWVVRPHGWTRTPETVVTPDTLLECTEMVDNHTEVFKLSDFMLFCHQYIDGANGMLVDQRFLPRIVEGEIRVLMILDEAQSILHKKPADGMLSATLFSGAQYSPYQSPVDPAWAALMKNWRAAMPEVKKALGESQYPLIWTADFILDWDESGEEAYRLGEMNCSCVGFTTQLEVANSVAEAAVKVIQARGL